MATDDFQFQNLNKRNITNQQNSRFVLILILLVQTPKEGIGQPGQEVDQLVRVAAEVSRMVVGLEGAEHLVQILGSARARAHRRRHPLDNVGQVQQVTFVACDETKILLLKYQNCKI